jgi:CheY-like chemotaxis protein
MMHKNLHIVIAEDDVDDAEIILESFEKHASFAKVELVKNGKELIEVLAAGNKPDLILTDINMPILSGFEAIKAIRNNPGYEEIPAFVYSTTIIPTYQVQGQELNISAFLIKPYNIDEFYSIPDKILSFLS